MSVASFANILSHPESCFFFFFHFVYGFLGLHWASLVAQLVKNLQLNLSSIPGPGSSPGEGIGYPLQYSWVSLVAQLVKNPPAMRETWV